MNQWHGGKGSKTRPYDKDKFNESFDRIFKQKNYRQIKHEEKIFGKIEKNGDKRKKPNSK